MTQPIAFGMLFLLCMIVWMLAGIGKEIERLRISIETQKERSEKGKKL